MRRASGSGEVVIEDIFELDLLERMLETVVGYEQRRRIRAQIRLVKRQLITEQETSTKSTVTSKTTKFDHYTKPAPSKVVNPPKPTPNRKDDIVIDQTTTEHHVSKTKAQMQAEFVDNPILDPAIVRKLDATRFPKADDSKPVWATQNILKKPSENSVTRKVTAIKKVSTTRTQPMKSVDLEEVDCVTSSYGIGPTDDDGKPLFGISALKRMTAKQSKSSSATGKNLVRLLF